MVLDLFGILFLLLLKFKKIISSNDICLSTLDLLFHIYNVLPSLQQSKSDGLCPKIDKQLSVPHTRFPVHSLSLSQSPSPISHVSDVVQQLAPSRPGSLPSHSEIGAMRRRVFIIICFPYV